MGERLFTETMFRYPLLVWHLLMGSIALERVVLTDLSIVPNDYPVILCESGDLTLVLSVVIPFCLDPGAYLSCLAAVRVLRLFELPSKLSSSLTVSTLSSGRQSIARERSF